MQITIHYNPDRLWTSHPFYANRTTSIPRWERQAYALLRLDEYTAEFVEDHDLPVAWRIDGADDEDERVIDAELVRVSEGDWHDYSRQREADYEYGVE